MANTFQLNIPNYKFIKRRIRQDSIVDDFIIDRELFEEEFREYQCFSHYKIIKDLEEFKKHTSQSYYKFIQILLYLFMTMLCLDTKVAVYKTKIRTDKEMKEIEKEITELIDDSIKQWLR